MTDLIQPYPAYKPSGVEWLGDVPAHWDVQRLRNVLKACNERNRPDLPLLSVVRERGVILRDLTSMDENHNFVPDDLSNYKVVHQGQFAMNKMKAWQGSYGVSDHDGIVSPAYFVFDVQGVTGKYLQVAMRSKAYVPFFTQASDGVRIGQWDLSPARMREIPVALPPLPEQAAIVRYLDHVDRRIRRYVGAKRRLNALLEEKKQAVINRAVTRGLDPDVRLKPSGVEWLGDVPEHWEVIALRYRYSQGLGKMLDSKRITGNYLLPYLRNTDVQWDHINVEDLPEMDIPPSQYEQYTVREGDLLVCEGGEVGRSALWSGELPRCGFQKALHRLRPRDTKQDLPRFIYYALRAASAGFAFSDGHVSTIAHLTGDKLRAHRFPFPSIAEQAAIVEHLDKAIERIDAAIAHAQRQIELVQEYRTRLIADVVTGKLDVREASAWLPDEDPIGDRTPPADDLPRGLYDIDESVEDSVVEEEVTA